MPFFTEADTLDILEQLDMSPNMVFQLRSQLAYVYSLFGDPIVDKVRAIILELKTFEAKTREIGLDSSSTLIKADVLEWSDNAGGRFGNIDRNKAELKNRLAILINMSPGGGVYGSTPILRS